MSEQRHSSPEYFNCQFVLRTCITNVYSVGNIEFEAIFDFWSRLVENIMSEQRRSSPEYFNSLNRLRYLFNECKQR
jgi:hypothetical protein